MIPADIARSYDSIADRWRTPEHPLNGIPPHERALQFVTSPDVALDVGCGCNGRFLDLLRGRGFEVEGVDLSDRMIALARQRDPDIRFHQADICDWTLPRQYGFITAWDSIWHVPLASQAAVLSKLCNGLHAGGILIFTLGGTDAPGEIRDANMGVPMYHATLGIPHTLRILNECGCVCRHLEYDQFPEKHVYVIAQRAT